MEKLHWYSEKSGDKKSSIFEVIKLIINDKKHFNVWNISWKYSIKGF